MKFLIFPEFPFKVKKMYILLDLFNQVWGGSETGELHRCSGTVTVQGDVNGLCLLRGMGDHNI